MVSVEVNPWGKFIYTQIVNGNVNQTQTSENYVKKFKEEKITEHREREFTKSERL